jgi:hypothetical protein
MFEYWLVGWLVYSSCFHLEHRVSVKCFVSVQFLNLRHSVGLLGRVISPSQGRYLTQTQNEHKQTSMLRVGFEPTISAFERAKTVYALDSATTVIGCTSAPVRSDFEVRSLLQRPITELLAFRRLPLCIKHLHRI